MRPLHRSQERSDVNETAYSIWCQYLAHNVTVPSSVYNINNSFCEVCALWEPFYLVRNWYSNVYYNIYRNLTYVCECEPLTTSTERDTVVVPYFRSPPPPPQSRLRSNSLTYRKTYLWSNNCIHANVLKTGRSDKVLEYNQYIIYYAWNILLANTTSRSCRAVMCNTIAGYRVGARHRCGVSKISGDVH